MVCSAAAARALGQDLDLGQAAGGLEVADEVLFAGGAQLGRGDELGQEHERPLGGQVESPLQTWEDADQEVMQPGQTLGLCLDQIAPPPDQQTQLEIELGGRLKRAQVLAHAHLLGDHAGVARIGLVLAAGGALPGAVDGQPRHVDQGEAGFGQHRLGQAGDATDDVQADAHAAAQLDQVSDESGDGARRVRQLAVDAHDAVGVDGGDPVRFLGDVDPDADPHGTPRLLMVARLPAHAVVALHSDDPQSLISGRDGLAAPGDLLPEPSRAASMKPIPAPPPHGDPGMPRSPCQALRAQQLHGRAA